jgi:hypothetical protein
MIIFILIAIILLILYLYNIQTLILLIACYMIDHYVMKRKKSTNLNRFYQIKIVHWALSARIYKISNIRTSKRTEVQGMGKVRHINNL